MIEAGELISTRCFTLLPEMDICRAVDMLSKKHLCGAPVVDRDRLYLGAFCEKQLMSGWISDLYSQFPPSRVQSMLTTIPTVTRSLNILEILDFFHHSCLCRLDVVENGKFVGVITRKKVLRFLKSQIIACKSSAKPQRIYLSASDKDGGDL